MKNFSFSTSSLLFFIIVFPYCIVAQDVGSIRKISNYSVPEKISAPLGDPLPAGTYSIGSGGYFPTIDSAFNKLSIDGIAGEVTLELIDNLYTAPTETFGFLLIGPITGAGETGRVIIKPAQNHQVVIEGDGGSVLYFSNTSYVTLDGVALTGPTTLTINSFHNSQFTWNDGIDFIDDSDNNIVTNINFNDEDVARPSTAIGFWTNSSGAIGAPDNNLIENNNIVQGTIAIYVSASFSNVYGFNNIIRDNVISASTGNIISWGMQLEKNENTIIENNVVNNIINSVANLELAFGINAHWCNTCIIRNNVVHSVSSNVRNGSTGILLSGTAGNEGYNNIIYNNMVFDIQSTSSNPSSRVAGIQTWQNHNPRVYYNSINLSGSGSNYMGSGALFIRTNTTNIEACDNIFVNTRDESPYCATSIYLYTNPTILTSDYNDLCYQPNPNSCLVRAAGGDYLNLEEWQATGHDMHSISEMPNFLALDDLHIDESIPTNLESGATGIYGINTDIDGDLRNTITPDIGADEFDGIAIDTLYVPGDYATIQEGIDAASNGNVVLVDEGTYYENINFKGKAITVASHFLVDVNDTTHIENTIIDGSQPSNPDSGSVVSFVSGEDTTSILKGFTIKMGTGTLETGAKAGGGVFIHQSGALICNNIIENNSLNNSIALGGGICVAFNGSHSTILRDNILRNNFVSGEQQAWGGGISLYGNGPTYIEDNIINDNSVDSDTHPFGGGISLYNCGLTYIRSNEITNNQAIGNGASGGGIDLFTSIDELIIHNNFIKGNFTDEPTQWGGGGISLGNWINNPVTLSNNIIVENTGYQGGGVLLAFNPGETNTVLVNNTIVYNAAEIGGGIQIQGQDSTTIILNSIIWGNTYNSGGQIDGVATVVYSDVEGGFSGEGNIDADPLFIEPANNNYRLQNQVSPCLETGIDSIEINSIMYYCPPFCINGVPRPFPVGTMPDMGACENPIPVGVDNDLSLIPNEFSLLQNYPNPFNPSTIIKYGIPERSFVELKVYDILGREITTLVNEEQDAGYYETNFNAVSFSSGIYFYQIKAYEFVETRKMVLIK